MLFLDGVNICTEDYSAIWNIVGLVIDVIRIGVPILLIVLGMIDFAKATISNDEKAQQKAMKGLLKRFLYAIGVFAVVWIVMVVFDMVAKAVNDSNSFPYEEAVWTDCWDLIRGNFTTKDGGTGTGKKVSGCYMCYDNYDKTKWKWGEYSNDKKCLLVKEYDEGTCPANQSEIVNEKKD